MPPTIYDENYGIIFDSEEKKQKARIEGVARWRNNILTMRNIEPLLRFTSYVVQMPRPQEEELYERWRDKADWKFQERSWTLDVGSVSLKPVEGRLRFALINGKTVLFCSSSGGALGAYVLNLWLRSHCNPSTVDGQRAYCSTEDFQHCLEQLAMQPENRDQSAATERV